MAIKSPSIGNKEAFYQGFLHHLRVFFPFFHPIFYTLMPKKEVFPSKEDKRVVLSIRNFWAEITHLKA